MEKGSGVDMPEWLEQAYVENASNIPPMGSRHEQNVLDAFSSGFDLAVWVMTHPQFRSEVLKMLEETGKKL